MRQNRAGRYVKRAEMTGLSVRTIQRVERGYPPSLETRNALVAVFETNLSSLNAEESAMDDEDQAAEEIIRAEETQALEYVQGLKSFYQHLLFCFFFMLLLAGGIFLVHGFIPSYI